MTAARTIAHTTPMPHRALNRALRQAMRPALGLALLASFAAAHAEVKPEVAEQLMRASGAWAQLGNVSPAVQSYLLAALNADASGQAAKHQDLKPVSQALQKAYAPDKLRAAAVQAVARQLSADDAARLKDWYASALGQQVSAVESQGDEGTADAARRLREGDAMLASLSPERRALLSDVLAGTHVVEQQTDVLIQSLQAIHRGTVGFMPKAAKVTPKELRSRLEAQRSELQQGYQSAGLSLASGFYAGLSDAQLGAYRSFLASPAGERLQALQLGAIGKALRDATEEATRLMGDGGSVSKAARVLPGAAEPTAAIKP
jgi:hypothetical protein